jgi:23S rRNA pseudouridine1911/1915/1917 synthase
MFPLLDALAPQILEEARDFLLVYKPPRIHTAPLKNQAAETLVSWTACLFPELLDLPGRRGEQPPRAAEGEGGLIHRLDYETQGLVLFARTQRGLESLLGQQEEGKIFKEYSALAAPPALDLPGFPPKPFEEGGGSFPRCIESPFRSWGPGRKAVRPAFPTPGAAALIKPSLPEIGAKRRRGRDLALDRGGPYRTHILERKKLSAAGTVVSSPGSRSAAAAFSFRLGLVRGFRHQIRSHLAWLGFPILNDVLYGGAQAGDGLLCLRAAALRFYDPSGGKERRFEIPELCLGPAHE